MSNRQHIALLVSMLVFVGVGSMIYKHLILDFPLWPSSKKLVWLVEVDISFQAKGEPVTVRVNLPDESRSRRNIFSQPLAPDYSYQRERINDIEMAVWQTPSSTGPQQIFFRAETYFTGLSAAPLPAPESLHEPSLSEIKSAAARELLSIADKPASAMQWAEYVLAQIHRIDNPHIKILLADVPSQARRLSLVVDMLAMVDVQARIAQGVRLRETRRPQPATVFLELFDGSQWVLLDPADSTVVAADHAVILTRGSEPLLEVFGGSQSQIQFSIRREHRSGFRAALASGQYEQQTRLDFSIYSLSLADQNTFKLLLTIPLGAFVVVVLRNLVGIRTSGTFMPVLIALSFVQTTLLIGLLLFVAVVSLGLVLRSYLSRLNLLLVPRISAVLVFVVMIYALLSIASHKMGIDWGLKVTFFPMVILSWTIERMSILWEEEGGQEVLMQGSGSLLTAVLAYGLMSNATVADLTFMYPELLLVVLAMIILIGTYSGYRLSDLRRFQPMEHLTKEANK